MPPDGNTPFKVLNANFQYSRKSTCGSVISENRTYIQNPKYPTAEGKSFSCTYTVNPISSGKCFLYMVIWVTKFLTQTSKYILRATIRNVTP